MEEICKKSSCLFEKTGFGHTRRCWTRSRYGNYTYTSADQKTMESVKCSFEQAFCLISFSILSGAQVNKIPRCMVSGFKPEKVERVEEIRGAGCGVAGFLGDFCQRFNGRTMLFTCS